MITDLAVIHTRIKLVASTLVSPEAISAAKTQGASQLANSPHSLPQVALNMARKNPVLGTAFASGAMEAAYQQAGSGQLALAQLGLGIALTWWGYHYEALALLKHALVVSHNGKREAGYLYGSWHSVLCERRLRGFPDACEHLLGVASSLEALGDGLGAARCRQDAAIDILLTDRHKEAMNIVDTSNAYFAANEQVGDHGIGLILQTSAFFDLGEFRAGLETLNQAEEAFVIAKMPAMLGLAWIYRGMYHYHFRQVGQAAHWLKAAGAQVAALQHEYYLTLCHLKLVRLEYEQGDIIRCLKTHQTISGLASELKLSFLAADNEMIAASLRLRQGDYENAADGYSLAKRLFDESGEPTYAALCTMNLGIVARHRGNFSASLRLLNEALKVFDAMDTREQQAQVYSNLGITYATFGYLDPAVAYFQTAIDLFEECGISLQTIRPTIRLAQLLIEHGETGRAQDSLKLVMEKAIAGELEMDVALCEHVHASALLREGKAGEALESYRRSLERFKQLGQQAAAYEARLGIAGAYVALGQAEAAEQELEYLEQDGLPAASRWLYHTQLARVAHLQRRPDQAMTSYLEALCQIRAARHSLTHEDETEHLVLLLQPIRDEAFSLAVSLRDPIQMLTIAELYGAQLLSARLGHQAGQELINCPHELLAQVTNLLNSQLGTAWTVLRYAWHENDLWLFTLTPTGLDYSLIPLAEARMALRACTNPDDSFRRFIYLGQSPAQSNAVHISCRDRQHLLEILIPEPIRQRLSPDHTLIIVPSHQLHGLAFHALLDGGSPLIEQTRVAYTQSIELLRILLESVKESPGETGHGLVLGQTCFEHPGYETLPHVEHEIKAVAQATRVRKPHLLDVDADLSTFVQLRRSGRLARYNWLHIATHAFADPMTGAFTGLILGSEIVDIEDIYQWQLKARMVTLSACQTGLGRWYYGDEVAGLAQAFLSAGAQTVIASLWLAADIGTAEFMSSFYTQMNNNGSSPVAALAEAQREAHRAGVEAYYWAPFSAFGRP